MTPRRPRITLPCRRGFDARPSRACLLAALAALLAAGCGGHGDADRPGRDRAALTAERQPVQPPVALAEGDGVRIAAAYLGPGWHAATVGKLGDCIALLVPSPPPPAPPTRFDAVPFDSVGAVQRGGESLSVDALRRAYGGCSPF